jgi:hypothetical protein
MVSILFSPPHPTRKSTEEEVVHGYYIRLIDVAP